MFGWILCVLTPLSFVVYGYYRPLQLVRPSDRPLTRKEVDDDEEEGAYAGGGERDTEMAALNESKVTSDNYREEE